jgi:acetylornithine deacetylase
VRSALAASLAELVRIPSVTGQEGAAIDHLERRLRDLGAEVDRWTARMRELEADSAYPGREVERDEVPVVAARLPGRRPGPEVLLTGHVDVVPPGDPERWTADPFEPRIAGGRLVGRGAADMKAGLTAALEVFERFARRRDFPGALWLLAVPGEEDGGTGTLSAIRRGVRADAVLIPEPTAAQDDVPRVVVAHGGAVTYKVSCAGRAAHAAFRLEGSSALDAFLVVHRALLEAEARLNDAERDELLRELGLPYPTSVGAIAGGQWASTVMDHLEAEVRVGAALGETFEDVDRRVQADLQAAARAAGGFLAEHPPVATRFGGAYRAARTPSDHPLVEAVRASAAEVYGSPAHLAAMPYGCDMGQWRHLTGAPVVVYGPGRARVAHVADEWVELDAVSRAADVLERTVDRVLST